MGEQPRGAWQLRGGGRGSSRECVPLAGRRLGKGSRGTSAAGEAGEEGPQDGRASDVGVGRVGPMTREGAQEISPAWGRGV